MKKTFAALIALFLLQASAAGGQGTPGPSLHELFRDLEQFQRELDRFTYRFDHAFTDGFRHPTGDTLQDPHLSAGNFLEILEQMPAFVDRYEGHLELLQEALDDARRASTTVAAVSSAMGELRPMLAQQGGGDPLGEILDSLVRIELTEEAVILASQHMGGLGKVIAEARDAYAQRMKDFLAQQPRCRQALNTCCQTQPGIIDCEEFLRNASVDMLINLCLQVDSERRCGGLPMEKPFLGDPTCQQAWEAGGRPFKSLITDWGEDAGAMIGTSFLGAFLDKLKAISDWDIIDVVKPELEDALSQGVGEVLSEDSSSSSGGDDQGAMPAGWSAVPSTHRLASTGGAGPGAILVLWDETSELLFVLSAEVKSGGALFPRVPVGTYKALLLSDGHEPRAFEHLPVDAANTTRIPEGPRCDPVASGGRCQLTTDTPNSSTDFVNGPAGFCLECQKRVWEGALEATIRGSEPCPEGGPDVVDGTFRVSFEMRDVAEPGPPIVGRFKSDPSTARLTWLSFRHQPCKDECTQALTSGYHPVTYVNVGRWLDDGSGYEIETHGLGDATPFHPISCGGMGRFPRVPNVYIGLVGGQLWGPSLLSGSGDRTVLFTSSRKDRMERSWRGGRAEGRVSLQISVKLTLEKK